MYILDIIPIANLPPGMSQVLSYLSPKSLSRGSIVKVKINKRVLDAVVIDAHTLSSQKLSLKKTGFQIKKIDQIISEGPKVSIHQFNLALWIAKNYVASLSVALKTVLPKFYLKKDLVQLPKTGNTNEDLTVKLILTSAAQAHLKMLPRIQKALDSNKQIFVLSPDVATVEYYYGHLKHLAPTSFIHSGLKIGDLSKAWDSIAQNKTRIIIGTRLALFYPFQSLDFIAVDDPENIAYKSDRAPRYHAYKLARHVAKLYSTQVLLLSRTQPLYTLADENSYKVEADTGESSRADIQAIDITREMRSFDASILSQQTEKKIVEGTRNKKRILILSARRGYASILACQNCGFTAKCPNCEVAFKVHRALDHYLLCHHCGTKEKLPNYCRNCNSNQLKPLGPAGVQRAYDQLMRLRDKNIIEDTMILALDTDIAKNKTEEDEVVESLENSQDASILIASPLVLRYRRRLRFDLVVILGFDSLEVGPDYRNRTAIIDTFEKLKDFEPSLILIQYIQESDLLTALTTRDYAPIYRQELEDRKKFKYPPHYTLTKVTVKNRVRATAERDASGIAQKIRELTVRYGWHDQIFLSEIYPAFIFKERDLYRYNILIKYMPAFDHIGELLRYLPTNAIVDVDPLNIL